MRHTDHLGTPRAVSEPSGSIVWRWISAPFGDTAPHEDPDDDGQTFTLHLRFPGQYHDAETGRHYNYWRTYDPAIGRFIIPDPIGLEGGLNVFSYVSSNPVNVVDPNGLVGLFGVSATTNAFKRNPLPSRFVRDLSSLSNRMMGTAAVAAVAVPATVAAAGPTTRAMCRAATSKRAKQTACALGFAAACARGETMDDIARELARRAQRERMVEIIPAESARRTTLPLP